MSEFLGRPTSEEVRLQARHDAEKRRNEAAQPALQELASLAAELETAINYVHTRLINQNAAPTTSLKIARLVPGVPEKSFFGKEKKAEPRTSARIFGSGWTIARRSWNEHHADPVLPSRSGAKHNWITKHDNRLILMESGDLKIFGTSAQPMGDPVNLNVFPHIDPRYRLYERPSEGNEQYLNHDRWLFEGMTYEGVKLQGIKSSLEFAGDGLKLIARKNRIE